MAANEIVWSKSSGAFQSGFSGKVGKYKFFSTHYDSLCAKGEENRYLLTCFLPGLKSALGRFVDEASARQKAEDALKVWIVGAGLTAIEE
jgi:hypothetical protein